MRDLIENAGVAAALAVCIGMPGTAIAEDEDLAADLRATEEAFAKTMADRDHEAFQSFLAEETVFFGSRGEIRGKEAVAAAWKPFFEGPAAPFSWKPDTAAVLDSGTLGLTSGPIFTPEGNRVGTFNSVWRRDSSGSWKVVFDRGCPPCECPPSAASED